MVFFKPCIKKQMPWAGHQVSQQRDVICSVWERDTCELVQETRV